MSGTIDVEADDGELVKITWAYVGNTFVGRAMLIGLRELADRMASDGATIMGDSHNWPTLGANGRGDPGIEPARMYGFGWGTMLAAAWLHDALSAIERGEDPREVG